MGRLVIRIFFFCFLTGCNNYPRDPNDSLQQAQTHGLKVGASESTPWIEFTDGEIAGTEAELVEKFAKSINAEVEWIKGSEGSLMKMLKANELHLVVGGITKETPWSNHVAITKPYTTQHYLVCSTSGHPLPKDLQNQQIAVARGSPLSAQIRERGGIAEQLNSLSGFRGLIAVPAYERDFYPCGKESLFLSPSKHVIALPMGENALLMALEKYLNEAYDR